MHFLKISRFHRFEFIVLYLTDPLLCQRNFPKSVQLFMKQMPAKSATTHLLLTPQRKSLVEMSIYYTLVWIWVKIASPLRCNFAWILCLPFATLSPLFFLTPRKVVNGVLAFLCFYRFIEEGNFLNALNVFFTEINPTIYTLLYMET